MIPKIIHYCWFGNNPLPTTAINCINSWKRKLPDYEIMLWNESNFDVNQIPYIQEAYKAKKYAFVSDYARFYVLYHHGGIYLDVDVEVVKSLDSFLQHEMFAGFERNDGVNAGLILGADKGTLLFKEVLKEYSFKKFTYSSKSGGMENVVTIFSKILITIGLIPNGQQQTLHGITIYPEEYFSPINFFTGERKFTKNTHTIHYFVGSWHPWYKRIRIKLLKNRFIRFLYNFIKK